VGHQPILKPGEQFEYTSWAQIATPQGSMQGRFFCITEDADWFESRDSERVDQVDQMVRHSRLLSCGGLGAADVHAAVDQG
jgi:uncharacterized protein affecting Mg2+/Co2+ transport